MLRDERRRALITAWQANASPLHSLAVVTTFFLALCPIRNLISVERCFAMPGVAMDVPAAEILLEARLLLLQIAIAVVAGCALYLGRREGRAYRGATAFCWALVAAGGFVWDKTLGNFAGPSLAENSALDCFLLQRSAHTHTMLTNGPLIAAVALALWHGWRLVFVRRPLDQPGRDGAPWIAPPDRDRRRKIGSGP